MKTEVLNFRTQIVANYHVCDFVYIGYDKAALLGFNVDCKNSDAGLIMSGLHKNPHLIGLER